MEQTQNQITQIIEAESSSSSVSTVISEKAEVTILTKKKNNLFFQLIKAKFEGSDDLTAQYERSAKRTELIRGTEKGSTSAKNPVYVEWHGVNYSISNEKNNKSSWKRNSGGNSNLEAGPNMKTIIEN